MGELLQFTDGYARPRGRRALIQQLTQQEQDMLRLLHLAQDREGLIYAARRALTAERANAVQFWVHHYDGRRKEFVEIAHIEPNGRVYHSMQELIDAASAAMTRARPKVSALDRGASEPAGVPGNFYAYLYRGDKLRAQIAGLPEWMVRFWLEKWPLPAEPRQEVAR